MDHVEFRRRAKDMVDYTTNYLEHLPSCRVSPGENSNAETNVSDELPLEPAKWDDIINEVEKSILPKLVHWNHPRFNAYLTNGANFPSLLVDMLINAMASFESKSVQNDAAQVLNPKIINWIAKLINLPAKFHTNTAEPGINKGIFFASNFEVLLNTVIAARQRALANVSVINFHRQDADKSFGASQEHSSVTKMVCYCSELASDILETIAMIACIKLHRVKTNDQFQMTREALKDAIEEDIEMGLQPIYVCGTFGTSSVGSFDPIVDLSELCLNRNLWFHIDATNSAQYLMLSRNDYDFMKDVEIVDSIAVGVDKIVPMQNTSCILWVSNPESFSKSKISNIFAQAADKTTTSNSNGSLGSMEIKPLYSLKLYLNIKLQGVKRLEKEAKQSMELALSFQSLVRNDKRFEVIGETSLPIVCFRMKGGKSLTEKLYQLTNATGQLIIGMSYINEKYVLKYVVSSPLTANEASVATSWSIIKKNADEIYKSFGVVNRLFGQVRTSLRRSSRSLSAHV